MAFRITSRNKLRILFMYIEVKFRMIWHIFATFDFLTPKYEQISHKIVITLYNIFKLKGLSKQVPKTFKIKPLYDELFLC